MRRRLLMAGLTLSALGALPAPGADEPSARPAGHVFSWGHELRIRSLPKAAARRVATPRRRWLATVNGIVATAGRNGLWFTGSASLPFDGPPRRDDPSGWITPANFLAKHRATGASWDVNVELGAAQRAINRHRVGPWDPGQELLRRRISVIDPGYQRTVIQEIRRLVPRYRGLPYRVYYTGIDEPMVVLPRGRGARSAAARRLATDTRARFGWAPPAAGAPTADPLEGLRWLAFSREVGDRLFADKAEQAALIHRLDPAGQVSPASFGFIDGFMPWDYTRLAPFADVVEADPYVSLDERIEPGRGRYNPGFASKLLSDLTGRRVRAIVQAFPYGGYRPVPADLDTWTAQALRAGASDITFYAVRNPRFTNRPLYARMLSIARRLRGTELPAAPVDPATLVVYATASEGQARPLASGPARARTRASELYTTYALLGELAHADFTFDSDTRLTEDPARLARARSVFLPRGETLDRPFAEALFAWVRAGGTLVSTDPDAFTRAPDGSSLDDVRAALVGAALDDADHGARMIVPAGGLAPGLPAEALTLPVPGGHARAFLSVPPGATAVARYPDGAPAAIVRRVGQGQVLALAAELMRPAVLDAPAGLVAFAGAVLAWRGARLGDLAWSYTLPGSPVPPRPPWRGSYAP